MKLTVDPASEHTELAAPPTVRLTGRPGVAVAATMYGGPPTVAALGAVELKVSSGC
jgi:hypothetical protein